MASPIDRINALKVEIAGLEFQKEIFLHSVNRAENYSLSSEFRSNLLSSRVVSTCS